MSHNRRIFIEALDRSESRRDGGYKQNWSFSLSGDNEEERRHDTSVVTMEEVDRQQRSSSPEGNKSPTLRHFSSSDPLRTYENRPNNHSRSLNKLGSGRRLSEISQTVATPSPMPNRTNYFIVSPPSQGVVLQGRAFQHSHINPAIKKHVQSNLDLKERNDFLTTQQIPPVQLDSIVLTCPEISDDENVSIKRRAQHKRRSSQESCCSFPSPVKPVEPLRSDGHLTMCCKCNQPSEDHSKCHRCGNVLSFQHAFEAQLSSPAARPPNRSQPSTGPSNLQLSKNFYSPASTMRAPRMEILPVRVTKTSFPAPHNGRPGTGLAAGTSSCCGSRVSTKGKRTAAAKQHELNDPIVLSSDDDEEADTASTGSVNRLDSVSPRPADSAHSSPAPSGGRVEAAVKSTGELDITADFFSDVDTKISLPRRPRMKDPVCLCGKPVPESFSPKNKKPKVSTAKCDSIILECRSIRVGTLRRMVTKPVVFSIENIQLETEAPQQMEDVSLRASELISCEWCSVRKLPVLFFQTTQAECLRLRTQLNMTQEKGNMWYDCAGNQSDEKYIVLIFENGLTMKDQMILEDILKEIGCTNNLEDFPTKLSFDEANSRLVNYNKATKEKEEKRKPTPSKITQVSPVKPVLTVAPTTQVAQVTQVSPVSPVLLPVRTRMATRQHSSTFLNEEDDDMAELHPTFTGPIVKLMVYPPPPAKGGISVTNEDLHCLNEGEFLNDVIIDFYLKYLVLEKLKKEDAQRSHVFSSFFYKRLNQREKRPVPDTANLPIQIRKHNRVKTWTRHVDLFQKDFIFVPINESAHWYLAVICFPGLQGPHYEDNSMYQGQTLAPGSVPGVDPALGPPMEDSFPDHCRPISPDTDDAPGAQKHFSPCGTGSSLEGHFSTDRTNVYSACANEVQEPSNAPSAKMNAQGDNLPQYTNGLHRICLSYGSGNDDSFTFPDDQSSCQDECSEDGALADETLSPDSSGWTSKPTVCKQPCILIMDSLRGPGRSAVVKTLREYLEVEWETRKGSQRRFGKEVMKGSNPRVPQQDNFSDCGVYVLQYVESFFENPIPSFQLPVNLTEWFPQQRMKTKREEITELILQLQTQQEVDKKETNEGSAACSPGEPEIEETSGSGVQNLHVSP